MGSILNNKKDIKDSFINYHCKKCNEIPLIYFSDNNFDIICSKHKISNINYNTFFNYIIYDYECSKCKKALNKTSEKYVYCYECDKNYCNKCILNHNQDNNNNTHFIIDINDKHTICKIHHKKYDRFCFKCKLNLCELCSEHSNHYIEIFKDVYPLNEDIIKFKQSINNIISENKENKTNIENKANIENNTNKINQENKEKESNEKKELLEPIKIKSLLIDSFSYDKTNYYYISNINNMIRRTLTKIDNNAQQNKNSTNIEYIEYQKKPNDDMNNIENKILIKSLDKNITEDFYSEIWCMKKLNDIQIKQNKKLELIAIGSSNHKILLLNTLTFKVHQIIDEHERSVYSLEQYKNDPTFLYSSSNDKMINIYKLNSNYKYELVQKLKKTEEKSGGEINKVIILSNKLLVTGDHRSITIWGQNEQNNNRIYYEDIHEIIINRDTCHLLEVNPLIFVATQYTEGHFQVYKNDGKTFPLLGELLNIRTHGSSSNGLSKINDKTVCSVANNIFYIICVEPIQVIQKFMMTWDYISTTIYYNYVTKDNFLYIKGENHNIIQYKIIIDEYNNFIELNQIGTYHGEQKKSYEKAIIPFDDGRIFFMEEKQGQKFYQMIA